MENAIIDYGPTSSRNFEEAQPLAMTIGTPEIHTVTIPRTNTRPTINTANTGLTPQAIADVYEVLAPMATDYANANLERAGQAQASYGPLAQAAMGDSQTAGIGNYTYNRLVRPAVDTMRDQLIVEGYSAALNKQINDSLNAARNNYNRAARRNSNKPSTNPSNTTGGGQTKIGGSTEEATKDDGEKAVSSTTPNYSPKTGTETITFDIGGGFTQDVTVTYDEYGDPIRVDAGRNGVYEGDRAKAYLNKMRSLYGNK